MDAERPGIALTIPAMVVTWIGGYDVANSTCAVATCTRPTSKRGMCEGHYKRWYKTGDVRADTPLRMRRDAVCSVTDCGRPVKARNLCSGHMWRIRVHGSVMEGVPVRPQSPGPCSVEGCSRQKNSGGLCRMHRDRVRTTGSLDGRSVEDRFWAKVDKSGECWEWTGKTRYGYGVHAYADTKQRLAHRFAYQQTHGEIPAGLELDHLCRNRRCVRPSHLEPVTHQENVRRALLAAPSLLLGTSVNEGTAEVVAKRGR